MSKSANSYGSSVLKISSLTNADQEQAVSACRALTDSIYQALDVTSEIRSVTHQGLGDTVLLWGGSSLEAFAVCHCGEGTEAGRDTCFIKFAAVQPRANADIAFDRMLDACESLAAERRLVRIEAGVNLNRSQAYRRMLQRGFRIDISGVAMHRPDSPAYNRPEIFVIDDWR
jgi:hypothetical protein